MSERKANRTKTPTTLVYGQSPAGLVFISREQALELAAIHDALGSSSTWGEFRSRIPARRYREFLRLLDDEKPRADDPFPGYDFPFISDGDYPEWPAQEMLRWAPPKVLQPPFGRIDSSVHNGDFLALDPDHEREIIAAFRETGFRCRKDNDLILRATGHSRPKLKKRSVAELLRALASSNWSVVSGARRALASRGSSVVPKSLAALKDKNEKVRSGAATVLGDIRPIPEAVISALIEALNDDSEDVFQAVCYRLPALRDKAGSVTPLLIERWKHGTYMVRDAAGWALGRVGGDPSVVVPALIEGMQDSCVSLRAAYSLGQIGVPAVPFLVKAHRQRQIDISNLAPVFAQMARSNNDADVRGRAAEILKLLRQEGILGSFERGVP